MLLEALCATQGGPLPDQAPCPVDDACAVSFVRTNETRSRGVSDPRRTGLGTGFGGWQRGSFTPRLSVHWVVADLRRTHARHKTPRDIGVTNSLAFKQHAGTMVPPPRAVVEPPATCCAHQEGGTLLPILASPSVPAIGG